MRKTLGADHGGPIYRNGSIRSVMDNPAPPYVLALVLTRGNKTELRIPTGHEAIAISLAPAAEMMASAFGRHH